MGRLKLQMQVTVDGFNPEGQDDELSWDEVKEYSRALLDTADTIALGRKTAVEFIPYWDKLAAQPDAPWNDVAKQIASARKVVFTKTLDRSAWGNTDVENGDLVDAMSRLKRDNAKDIIVYGGISFVSSLVRTQLVDELHLFVNPFALGRGKSIFSELDSPLRLRLLRSIACNSGHVLLHYELKK